MSETEQNLTELERTKRIVEDLNSILEGSFDGVLVTDGEANVLMVNKSYERITGLKKEDMIGRNMRDMLNPVYMKNSVALLAIEEKKPVSMHHTTKHGRNIIVTGTPIFDETGKITKTVVNARDISEIYELRQELIKAREMEKIYFNQLQKTTKNDKGRDLVVAGEAIQKIFGLADKLGNFNTTIMITGESGVGKEEIAKYIHDGGAKRGGPFIAVNCGAIPENLLESELFGYAKGAFSGASAEGKKGLFEAADGGTIFLDEIAEMPLILQVKLLRVIETFEITRVGSTEPVPVNSRIVVSTNKNLEKEVADGAFRKDLFYRLNVVQIVVPPLRERQEDIAPLALSFLRRYNSKYGQNKKLTYDVIKEMEQYSWPGNIRELKNTIERMVIVRNNEYLQILDLPWFNEETTAEYEPDKTEASLNEAMDDFEKKILSEAMKKYGSTRKMADVLKVDQATIVRKIKKHGLNR